MEPHSHRESSSPSLTRRNLIRGVAWTTPIVMLAIATPAAAASGSQESLIASYDPRESNTFGSPDDIAVVTVWTRHFTIHWLRAGTSSIDPRVQYTTTTSGLRTWVGPETWEGVVGTTSWINYTGQLTRLVIGDVKAQFNSTGNSGGPAGTFS